MIRVGIVGFRSFIARELMAHLAEGYNRQFSMFNKEHLGDIDFSEVDCLYLFLGRAKPSDEERAAEKRQVIAFSENKRRPKRVVYISSMDHYGTHKGECERILIESLGPDANERLGGDTVIIRPAAVFGPGQDPESPMLIPSLVRDPKLELRTPDRLTKFISVRALAAHLAQFSNPGWVDIQYHGQVFTSSMASLYDVPGTFTASPRQITDLLETFKGLQGQRG